MNMSSPDEKATPTASGFRWARWWLPLVCGVFVGLAYRVLFSDKPGEPFSAMNSAFAVVVPIVIGMATVYVAELTHRRNWGYYFRIGAGANVLFVLGTLLTKLEGLICAVLAVPLFAVLGGLGGLLMGAVCRRTGWPRNALYSIAVLPLVLGPIEHELPPPNEIGTVERSQVISANPENIWPVLFLAENIRPEEIGSAWMYRIGVPLPTSAMTDWSGNAPIRHITMGRAIHFDQIAAELDPGRRVRWLYRFSSDSFPPWSLDDHVRIGGAYFDVIDTEYALRPVPGGTEFSVRMTYRVSTTFNWYARPIADFLVGNFENAALDFYAHRAQRRSTS
jgi:hypothetical protein